MVEKLLPVVAALTAFAGGRPPNLPVPPDLPPAGITSPVQQIAPPPANGAAIPPAPDPGTPSTAACTPIPGRTLGSMFIRDDRGDVVARVQDLVIEPRSGRVLYAAVSFGRMVGMGDVVYVVPWDRMEIAPGCHELRLELSPEAVKQGPRFSLESWPNFADEVYTASVRDYYRSIDSARPKRPDDSARSVFR
jgi:hypothetical protein